MRKVEKISTVKDFPYPHIIVKNFLDDSTLDLVIDALAGLEYDFKESDLFSYWASVELTDIDHPAINILRDDLGDELWRNKVAEAFSSKPLSSIDMAAYVYGLGDFLSDSTLPSNITLSIPGAVIVSTKSTAYFALIQSFIGI